MKRQNKNYLNILIKQNKKLEVVSIRSKKYPLLLMIKRNNMVGKLNK